MLSKGTYYPLFDHGFIGFVDVLGDDESIERAARTSFGMDPERTVTDRRGLLRYLLSHRHMSPFEMGEMVFHIGAPLFVIQQWLRHRTANLNQESHRYTEPTLHFFTPGEWRAQSGSSKQGSDGLIPPDSAKLMDTLYHGNLEDQQLLYQALRQAGTAKELARIGLPAATYTQLYWKCDVRNLLHFLGLRCDPHAQWEIRAYANIMAAMVREYFPMTFEAWLDYHFDSASFSRLEMQAMQLVLKNGLLAGEKFGYLPEGGIESLTFDSSGDSEAWEQVMLQMTDRERLAFPVKLMRLYHRTPFELPEESMTEEEMKERWLS